MNLSTARLAILAALSAAPAVGAQAPGTTPSTARPAARSSYVDDWHQRVVRAAGLDPLDQTTLRSGDREIRIWIGGGMTAPSWLYRITSEHGHVTGEIIWYWMEAAPPAIQMDSSIRSMLGDACVAFAHRENASTCRTRFARRPAWSKVLDSIDALGLWTMPDAPPRPANIVTTDGWGVIVELRDGDAYRTHTYDNPDVHSSVPSVAHVAEIARTLRSVDSLIVPWGPRATASPREHGSDTARTADAHAVRGSAADDRFARAAKAAGLAPLSEASLARGDREVRVWLGGGLVNPFWMYRLVSRGGHATGEIVFYWFASEGGDSTFTKGVREWIGDACDRFGRASDARACHGRFEHTPPWRTLLDSLDALGIRTLPDPSTLPNDRVMVLDGSSAFVEVRDGEAFRSYTYDDPGRHPTWPSDARMAAIVRTLEAVDTFLVRRHPGDHWLAPEQ